MAAQEYTITRVSSEAPREWGTGQMKTYYIKVAVDGHVKPISVGKKSPDALKVGDTIYGTIIEDAAHSEDKFKSEQNPGFGGGSAKAAGGKSSGFNETTMYVSYAKDIAVALIARQMVPGSAEFTEAMIKAAADIVETGAILQKGKEHKTEAQAFAEVFDNTTLLDEEF
jgi:hypothetical protein